MVRFLTYNVHCVPAVGCAPGHLQNVARSVQEMVRRDGPSVIVFTEVFVRRAHRALVDALNEVGRWESTRPPFEGGKRVPAGVMVSWDTATVSRDNDAPVTSTTFSRCCQIDCLSRKGAVHVPLVRRADARRFHVVGTHMQSWTMPMVCGSVRDSQLAELGRFCVAIGDEFPGRAIVVAGDFNTPPRALAWGTPVAPDEGTRGRKVRDYFYIVGDQSAATAALLTAEVAVLSANPSDHRPVVMDCPVDVPGAVGPAGRRALAGEATHWRRWVYFVLCVVAVLLPIFWWRLRNA